MCCMCEDETADIDIGPSESGEPIPVCDHCLEQAFNDFFSSFAKEPN